MKLKAKFILVEKLSLSVDFLRTPGIYVFQVFLIKIHFFLKSIFYPLLEDLLPTPCVFLLLYMGFNVNLNMKVKIHHSHE